MRGLFCPAASFSLTMISLLTVSSLLATDAVWAQDHSAAAGGSASTSPRTIPLGQLDLTKMRQGFAKPRVDASVDGTSLTIAGRQFAHGVGTHADSILQIVLDGKASRFQAWVGHDNETKQTGTIDFKVIGDGQVLFESGIMRRHNPARRVDVPLDGVKLLTLRVGDGHDGHMYDHADWAQAQIITAGADPVTVVVPPEDKIILTPKPGPQPHLNNPVVYGCRPGHPFLYRIPATGVRPMEFSAEGLPDGLTLDGKSGIIRGTAPDRGDYKVTLRAKNSAGEVSKAFAIRSGDQLALTPYMGWNHWYAYFENISDAKMRQAADAMVANGMADFGYDFVCIDDCWMRKPGSDDRAVSGDPRNKDGNILPNSKFPDMKALTDYIHGKGLKTGIYSSPGPLTCQQYAGSYDFEANDARQYADWGFDLLKYDWCSYTKIAGKDRTLKEMKQPYELMGPLIAGQNRDIIFNLCQYGMGDVWRWGADVHAQSWRTSGDLGYSLDKLFSVVRQNANHRAWQGPGHWNDPDYLQIGYIGDLRGVRGDKLSPVALTPTEQYSFMSLWVLSAAPLVYSGDLTRLDEFTLNILCNSEVIEVDQDPLGQCGAPADLSEDAFLLIKEMADGSKAVGLCNGGDTSATLSAKWGVLGVAGRQRVRDLWTQKDIGEFDGEFSADVPSHGVKLVRIWPADASAR